MAYHYTKSDAEKEEDDERRQVFTIIFQAKDAEEIDCQGRTEKHSIQVELVHLALLHLWSLLYNRQVFQSILFSLTYLDFFLCSGIS